MSRQLTPEFAATVPLPLNPIARHRETKAFLSDPDIVGDGIRVVVNGIPPVEYIPASTAEIRTETLLPLIGRRALKNIAKTLDVLERIV